MKVSKSTRAGLDGRVIECPHCGKMKRAYHFSWSGSQCGKCKRMVDKYKWLVASPERAETVWKEHPIEDYDRKHRSVFYRTVVKGGKKVTLLKLDDRGIGGGVEVTIPLPSIYIEKQKFHPIVAQIVLMLLQGKINCPECHAEKHKNRKHHENGKTRKG